MTDSPALLTDHYELTMVDAAVQAGMAGRRCVFELFARRLPAGRRYGVVAGTGRALDLLDRFRFDGGVLDHLRARAFLSEAALDYLASWQFTGEVVGYPEGELYFPYSPVLTVEAPFGEAVVLETLLLSVFNYDAAVASAAARMVQAARGRPLMEFGSRRAHEEAAVAAARAAYVAGFAGTSNLEANRRHGIPTLGTSAHAFILLFGDEEAAFAAQVAGLGADTTLLVDTYDIAEGIDRAVVAAGPGLGGIRLDSGDLFEETVKARAQLDALGATGTKIVLSGDLDEYAIDRLANAPADSYGVGTRVVTGSGHPTVSFVYKLVAREDDDGAMVGVAKTSAGKATQAGRKFAWRRLVDGAATAEVLRLDDQPEPDARALQAPLVTDGQVIATDDLDATRAHHRRAMAELPLPALRLTDGPPCIPTEGPS